MSTMLAYIAVLALTYLAWRLFKRPLSPKSDIDNLHGPPSPSWLAGHLLQIYDKHGWDFHRDLHTKYGPVSRLQSMFGQPMLCVFDPLAMHSIVLKDQHIYEEMGWFLNFAHDSLGPGLVSTTGETHRRQRKLLSPVFSSKNLRRITPVFYEVVRRLRSAIKSRVEAGAPSVDVAHYMGRTALELIGQAALGHSFDPLTEERFDPYAEALKSFVPAMADLSQYFQIYRFMRPVVPAVLRRPLMNLLPSRRVKRFLHVIDTMHENAHKIYTEKKHLAELLGSSMNDGENTKDLITILLMANAGASVEDALPEEELIAQLSTLVFVATDTSSNALTLILERLAEHPQVQERLRAEIMEAQSKHDDGTIPNDELMSMPYLDAVCRETLRVNVPAQLRLREAQADAALPLSKPVQGIDGSMMEFIFVPKGTLLFVAIQGSNISQDIWGPDAREWRPERWLEPLPETVMDAKVPGIFSNLMTFWGGGRSCIGMKFSQLEIKVVLTELLSTFKFEKTDAPVVWNLGEVIHPTVGKDSLQPAYPMKVTLVRVGAQVETS